MRCRRGLLALGLGATAGPAMAFGNLLLIDTAPAATTVAAGPSVWQLPRYPGARTSSTRLVPGLDIYMANGLFISTDTGVGWNLSRRADLQAGARLWPQFGRRQADMPQGLPGIGTRLQTQAFVNYAPLPALLLQAAVLHGAGRRHDGLQFEWGATSGLPLGDDLLGIGVAASCANRAYRESYFGVSAAQSAASGLPATPIGAGWQDVSLTFSAEHKLAAGWRLDAQFIAARLLGPAAASPLTASKRQSAGTVTLWHAL